MYVWYQHMQSPYAEAWQSTDPTDTATYNVTQGQVLGWQGKSGASTVHLHLSTRVCENSRADGQSSVLDPEMNPFQLIGSDNGQAPTILQTTTEFVSGDLVFTDKSSSDFRIFAMSRDWREDEASWTAATSSVHWQTDGGDGASDRATIPLGLVSLPATAPVTGNILLNPSGRAQIEAWIDGSAANHGLMIRGDAGETNGLDIESGDGGTTAPWLKLVYASTCGG